MILSICEELIFGCNDVEQYLEKKTGEKPNKRLTEDVATALSEMGKLFINNAELLNNDS